MSKKNLLSKMFFYSGIVHLKRRFSKRNRLIILAYHRILDFDKNFEYDENLISANVAEFEKQVSFLKKHYNILSLSQVHQLLSTRGKLPPRSLVITFDDGFMDNYENAYSILRKYSVGATFFVTTGLIGKKKLFWFDRCAFIAKKIKGKLTLVSKKLNHSHVIDNSSNSKCTSSRLLSFLKRVPNQERVEFVELLERYAAENDIKPKGQYALNYPMTWENLAEMKDNGMEIGAHTVTHPILANLSDEEIKDEIVSSKRDIESRLDINCNCIAYPVGGNEHINSFVLECVKTEGFDIAATYVHGDNIIDSNSDLVSLKRIGVDRSIDIFRFSTIMEFPQFFGYK